MLRAVFINFLILGFIFLDDAYGQDKIALDSLTKQAKGSNITLKVNALNELCRIFTGTDNVKAMQLANEAVHFSKTNKNDLLLAQSQNRLGTIYDYKGVVDSANMNFLAALKLFEKLKNKSGIAAVYQNIGVMYYYQDDLDKALTYYEKALKLRMQTNEMDFVAKLQNNVAVVYRRQRKFNEAIRIYMNALAIKLKFNDKDAIASTYANLATVYLYKESFDSAKILLNKSLEINNSINSPVNLAGNYFLYGEIFFNEGKFKESRESLEKSITYATKAESNDILFNDYELLWRVDTAVKDYKSAVLHIDLENVYKANVFKKEKAEAVEKLNVLYQIEKKDKEIVELNAVQEKEKAQKRLLVISLILSFLILITTAVYFRRLRSKNKLLAIQKKEVEEKTQQLNKQASEIAQFRTQMNPHFMFNALVSIQKSILTEDKNKATHYLTQLSKLMRLTLDNSEKEFISLKNERIFLNLYIDFEKSRFSNLVEFKFSVDDSIDEENTLIPPMILQPFIENAMKHGLSPMNSNGILTITIHKKIQDEKPCLFIEIRDNGVGRTEAEKTKVGKSEAHKSKGIQITIQRINNTCADNGIKTTNNFIIEDLYDESGKSSGTNVMFRLPVIEIF